MTLIAAFVIGSLAGGVTYLLHHLLKLQVILASIITNTAILSIGLRIMSQPDVSIFGKHSIFTDANSWFGFLSDQWAPVLLLAIICLIIFGLVGLFLYSQLGLAFRMAGVNATMARSSGVSPKAMLLLALLLGNGLAGLSGALITQSQGFADVHMGDPILITGLTGILLGELFVRGRAAAPLAGLAAVVIGSYLYRYLIALALRWGVNPQLFNLLTAIVIVAAITINLLATQASDRSRARRLTRDLVDRTAVADVVETRA
jgi:putative ABC transport system permease protein